MWCPAKKNSIHGTHINTFLAKNATIKSIRIFPLMKKIQSSANKRLAICSICTATIVLSFIIAAIASRRIILNLGHDDIIHINEEESYNDTFSSTASYCILFLCKDISPYIYYENNFSEEIGVYENAISIEYGGLYAEKKWTLEVLDITSPIISLNGDKKITFYVGEEFIDLGVTVNDNYDIDIQDKVEITSNLDISTPGKYKIKYTVTDAANNSSSIFRRITVKSGPIEIAHDNSNLGTDENFYSTNRIMFYQELEKYISDNNLDVAVGFYDITSGNQYTYNADKVFYGASLVKTVAALYAYEKVELSSYQRSLAEKSISVSNNDAHMSLVDSLGRNNVKEYGNALGAKKFMTGPSSYYYGNTTVSDQLSIWKYLQNNIDSMNNGSELKSYFKNTFYNNIQAGCGVETLHKYGLYGGVFHDVGIVLDGDTPYIVAILTNESSHGQKVIQDISKIIYDGAK